jgi:DNA-binding YbaB/EbfC family protein
MIDFNQMGDMMRQAQEMQQQMKDNLKKMAIEGSAGGGAVKVVINGNKELTKIDIDPEVAKDVEMLGDLILASLSSAYSEADKRLASEGQNQIGNVLQGLDLSALGNLFQK